MAWLSKSFLKLFEFSNSFGHQHRKNISSGVRANQGAEIWVYESASPKKSPYAGRAVWPAGSALRAARASYWTTLTGPDHASAFSEARPW